MNKKQLFLAGVLCVGSLGSVQAQDAMNMNSSSSMKTELELSQGYRRDSLKFKGSHGHHLKFKGIDTWTTRVDALVTKDDMFMKALVGYGDVYDGKLHAHNHHVKVKGDYTADFALTFGKRYNMENGWFVAPTVGYGVYLQDFHTKHKHGNKARVKATWYSPQFGVCVNKQINDAWNAYFDYTLLYPMSLQVKSNTKHNHNRHTMENSAYKSVGNIFLLGANWKMNSNWSLRPEIEVMEFFSRGGDSHGSHNNKKHVDRSSIEYRLVLGYTF
ncbi:MAG: hypothetical protein JSR37_00030 [Verrucomicrobia bacterium]|nr:hypothetical protein [Verrucomicrobiota bacterium]